MQFVYFQHFLYLILYTFKFVPKYVSFLQKQYLYFYNELHCSGEGLAHRDHGTKQETEACAPIQPRGEMIQNEGATMNRGWQNIALTKRRQDWWQTARWEEGNALDIHNGAHYVMPLDPATWASGPCSLEGGSWAPPPAVPKKKVLRRPVHNPGVLYRHEEALQVVQEALQTDIN